MIIKENIKVINKNNDFRRIYARGKYFVSPIVVTYVMKSKKNVLKYGITASKKVGNAVKRNRAKRIIKEPLYEILPKIKKGYSIIFVARGKTPFFKSYDVKKDILRHLSAAKLLND